MFIEQVRRRRRAWWQRCDIEHSTCVWMCGHSVREHELARLVVVGGRDLQLGGHESGADLLLAQVRRVRSSERAILSRGSMGH